MQTKIALPTDNGSSLSRHFGQARYFKVVTVENNQVISAELREKASHQHGDHAHDAGVHPGQAMVASIADCQVLVCGGMGSPAYQRATQAGLKVYLSRQAEVDGAVQAYLAGTLDHDMALIHVH